MHARALILVSSAALLLSLPACGRDQGRDVAFEADENGFTAGAEGREEGAQVEMGEEEDQQWQQQGAQEGAERQQAQQERIAEVCPVLVPGTEVTAQNTREGVNLIFTTTGDVDELRERVDEMAQLYDEGRIPLHAAAGQQGAQQHGAQEGEQQHGAQQHGAQQAQMLRPEAQSEEVEGGAQIVLTAREEGQLQALRQGAQQHAQQMAEGECPMIRPEREQGQGAEG